mgnify:FL=1|tara:strand:+ start:445 stop:708 length:264 start_codon:yes stop_codon:yes gene_type:complete
MTKIISDVQIKKMMKIYNPKREWANGSVDVFRENAKQVLYFLLSEIENSMEGNKRVKPLDIVNAYNNIANAIMLAKQPVLRHFMEEE